MLVTFSVIYFLYVGLRRTHKAPIAALTTHFALLTLIQAISHRSQVGLLHWRGNARRRVQHRADALQQAVGDRDDGDGAAVPPRAADAAEPERRRTLWQELSRWIIPFFESLLPFHHHAPEPAAELPNAAAADAPRPDAAPAAGQA